MENFFARSFTVYDTKLDTGSIIPGGYVLAAIFSSAAEASEVLAKYRADTKRYDVRPSGAQAIADAAMEIAEAMPA